jgi:regulatory protein
VAGRFARRTDAATGRRGPARSSSRRAQLDVDGPSQADEPKLEKRALQRAYARLAFRDQSSVELQRALTREGFSREAIEHALARLAGARLIDDQAFAERLARRSLGRGLGRKRIAINLAARGVPRATARAGLEQALTTVSERDALETVARRYWEVHARVPQRVRLRRLWAHLLRRGFPAAAVARCLGALCPDHSDDVEALSSNDA